MTMDKYIKKETAINSLLNDCLGQVSYSREDAADCIRYMDAADVAPVRHGRWEARAIPRSDPDGDWIALEYHCSVCNRLEYRKENYCPNCGAKMDGVDDG